MAYAVLTLSGNPVVIMLILPSIPALLHSVLKRMSPHRIIFNHQILKLTL